MAKPISRTRTITRGGKVVYKESQTGNRKPVVEVDKRKKSSSSGGGQPIKTIEVSKDIYGKETRKETKGSSKSSSKKSTPTVDVSQVIKTAPTKQQQNRQKYFERQVKLAEQGKRINTKELFRIGVNPKIITNLAETSTGARDVAQYGNLSVDQVFTNQGRVGGVTRTVDPQTQVTAYKIGVNQILRDQGGVAFQPLPATAPVSQYQERYKKFEDFNTRLRNIASTSAQEVRIKENWNKLLNKQGNAILPASTVKAPLSARLSLGRIENYLRDAYFEIANKRPDQRTTKEMALISVLGLGSASVGTVRKIPTVVWQMIYTVIRPDEAVKGLYKLLTDKETQSEVSRLAEQFGNKLERGDPDAVSSIASEIFGFGVGNRVFQEAGKVASVSPAVRRAQEARFVLSQPVEIRPYLKSILRSARVQEKLSPTNLKDVSKVNFNEVLGLNKVEAKALEKTLRQTDSVIFGSLASRAISQGKTKIPKDVDIATKNKDIFLKTFIQNLPAKSRTLYKVSGENIKKGNIKLLDVKDYDRLRPSQTIFGTGRLPINTLIYNTGKPRLKQVGLKIPTQKLVDIKGIKLVGFGEQTTRKALGTLQVILERTGRRAKDPSAFVESLEIQLRALKGRIPKSKYVNKWLLNRKAKELENAIKLLKSKTFENLLNKKVPNLTKEYPILTKVFNLSSRAKQKISKNVEQRVTNIRKRLNLDKKKKTPSKKSSTKTVTSTKRKSSLSSSRLPKSRLPKSRMPKSSKTPSSRTPSSKVPKSSKTPFSNIPQSKLPSQLRGVTTPSIIPNVPSNLPSKIKESTIPPSRVPSILATSKIPPSRVPSIIPVTSSIVDPPNSRVFRIQVKDFTRDIPNNQVVKYVGKFRERVNPRKIYNARTNPVVVKAITRTTTKNRMINELSKKADNSAVRSIEIEVIGVSNKKRKDVKLDKVLSKFARRKGRDASVLKLVEESKYAIDSAGEKRELKRTRKIARAKPKTVKSTKKKKANVSVKKGKKVSNKKTTTKKKKK